MNREPTRPSRTAGPLARGEPMAAGKSFDLFPISGARRKVRTEKVFAKSRFGRKERRMSASPGPAPGREQECWIFRTPKQPGHHPALVRESASQIAFEPELAKSSQVGRGRTPSRTRWVRNRRGRCPTCSPSTGVMCIYSSESPNDRSFSHLQASCSTAL